MNQDNWLSELDDINLLALYEVAIDIKEALDLSPLAAQIPFLPAVVRFPELQPSQKVAVRNRHETLRKRAAAFLSNKGILTTTMEDALTRQINVIAQKPAILELMARLKYELEARKGTTTAPQKTEKSDFWVDLHPEVVKLAQPRFEANHLADAVEASFKEVNERVKSLLKTKSGQEDDGASLMKRAFSPKNPIISLADLSTTSGQSEQLGYMEIFAGAMTGIRNPKAHSNIVIDEKRAIHLLYLASLLMYKLDEAK